MDIQLVVFDMAGTTVRDANNVHQALQTALQKGGFEFSVAEINPYMGIPKPLAIRYLLEQRPATQHLLEDEEFVQEIHAHFVAEMLHFYRTSPEVAEKPFATEVFRDLKAAGIKVALDTGFSRDIVDAVIQRLGWDRDGLIDLSVASDEVPRGRPHPDLIFRAMQLAGVTDSQAVAKVGDTSSDLQEGTAAQCRYVIGVTTGAFTREALINEPHTHLVADLREVLAIVLA